MADDGATTGAGFAARAVALFAGRVELPGLAARWAAFADLAAPAVTSSGSIPASADAATFFCRAISPTSSPP